MNLQKALRHWLPPAIHGALGRASGRSIRFEGGWTDWAAAAAACSGYDDTTILQRVVAATREVVAGRANGERDAVLLDHWVPPFQILAPLLRHALRHGGRLDVVDFGGSLGSTYRQCRPYLPRLSALRWQVVEQPGFVAAGRAEFTTDVLSFHALVAELPPPAAPRILLLSSALQYLEHTRQHIDAWGRSSIESVVIDRSPVGDGTHHLACAQHVPRHIYPASYPCWIFSRAQLLEDLQRHWRLLGEFDCPEGRHVSRRGPAFEFKGFLLERPAA